MSKKSNPFLKQNLYPTDFDESDEFNNPNSLTKEDFPFEAEEDDEEDYEAEEDGLYYSIYPQGGVVKAQLKGVQYNAVAAIEKLTENHSKYLSVDDIVPAFIKDEYRGKARCNIALGDVYDEDTGCEIARKKCMAKYHKAFDNKIRDFLKDVRTLCAGIEHYCDKNNIDYSSVKSVKDIKDISFNGYKVKTYKTFKI
jgi:hypothetical protein